MPKGPLEREEGDPNNPITRARLGILDDILMESVSIEGSLLDQAEALKVRAQELVARTDTDAEDSLPAVETVYMLDVLQGKCSKLLIQASSDNLNETVIDGITSHFNDIQDNLMMMRPSPPMTFEDFEAMRLEEKFSDEPASLKKGSPQWEADVLLKIAVGLLGGHDKDGLKVDTAQALSEVRKIYSHRDRLVLAAKADVKAAEDAKTSLLAVCDALHADVEAGKDKKLAIENIDKDLKAANLSIGDANRALKAVEAAFGEESNFEKTGSIAEILSFLDEKLLLNWSDTAPPNDRVDDVEDGPVSSTVPDGLSLKPQALRPSYEPVFIRNTRGRFFKRIAAALGLVALGTVAVTGGGIYVATNMNSDRQPESQDVDPNLSDVDLGYKPKETSGDTEEVEVQPELADTDQVVILDPIEWSELKEEILALYGECYYLWLNKDKAGEEAVQGANDHKVIIMSRTDEYVSRTFTVRTPEDKGEVASVVLKDKEFPTRELQGPIQMEEDGSSKVEVFVPVYSPESTSITAVWELDGKEIDIRTYSNVMGGYYGLKTETSFKEDEKALIKADGSILTLKIYKGAERDKPLKEEKYDLMLVEAPTTESVQESTGKAVDKVVRPKSAPKAHSPSPRVVPVDAIVEDVQDRRKAPKNGRNVEVDDTLRLLSSNNNGGQNYVLTPGEGTTVNVEISGRKGEKILWVLDYEKARNSKDPSGNFKLTLPSNFYPIPVPPVPEDVKNGTATLKITDKKGKPLEGGSVPRFTVSE